MASTIDCWKMQSCNITGLKKERDLVSLLTTVHTILPDYLPAITITASWNSRNDNDGAQRQQLLSEVYYYEDFLLSIFKALISIYALKYYIISSTD